MSELSVPDYLDKRIADLEAAQGQIAARLAELRAFKESLVAKMPPELLMEPVKKKRR